MRVAQERVPRAGRPADGAAPPARLLAALWRAFGGAFVRLGGLKLCNDALNFAGAARWLTSDVTVACAPGIM